MRMGVAGWDRGGRGAGARSTDPKHSVRNFSLGNRERERERVSWNWGWISMHSAEKIRHLLQVFIVEFKDGRQRNNLGILEHTGERKRGP